MQYICMLKWQIKKLPLEIQLILKHGFLLFASHYDFQKIIAG